MKSAGMVHRRSQLKLREHGKYSKKLLKARFAPQEDEEYPAGRLTPPLPGLRFGGGGPPNLDVRRGFADH